MALMDMGGDKSINIQHVAGVVEQTEIERLRRLIFRSTKGKSYMYIQEYDDRSAAKKRSVYIIVFWDGDHIRDRIQKICDSFSGQRFDLPDLREIQPQIEKVESSITDAKNIFDRTKQSLRDQLIQFDKIEGEADGAQERKTSSTIYIYKMFLAKEKALYRTLNQMKWQNQSFIGYFWAPIEQENTIKSALSKYSAAKIVAYDNHSIPRPTYFKTTDFTAMFQLIVDTYGVPTYLEANPVPVSIVTFPFFFGMMFGDMGHGSLFLFLGAYLTLFNNQLKGGALNAALPMRYLFLLMGIMAVYCGFIYNEWFAIPTEIFTSCYSGENRIQWNATQTDGTTEGTTVIQGDYVFLRKSFDCNYPFGQDPVWGLTSNKLNLSNNIKMKLAVIMGVLHMSIGIIIKGTNTIYFGRWADFWTEVATGLTILLGLFGWMDLLIVAKWFHRVDIEDTRMSPDVPQNRRYYDTEDDTLKASGQNYILAFEGDVKNQNTPSVINIMITEVFSFGDWNKPGTSNLDPVFGSSNDEQYGVGVALLIIVVILIPVMLCTKPIMHACLTGDADEEQDEIEFTNINRENDMSQPLQPGIQRRSDGFEPVAADDSSRKMTDDMMLKRQKEMQSLDAQLRDMGTKHEAHSFGEVFIHQMIETIEFVLGTVSNTASYLRLWALSLAHGQLAEVFMDLLMKQYGQVYTSHSVVGTVCFGIIAWPVFWTVTFAVLMFMDALECFLHTLRLHWVEFQNKFFKGEGYAFKPYSYITVLSEVLED